MDFQLVRARRSGSTRQTEVDGFPSRFVFRPDFHHQLDRPIFDGLLQHVTSPADKYDARTSLHETFHDAQDKTADSAGDERGFAFK
jgi:hypothetical protein